MDSPPLVSIIIPTRNERGNVEGCLQSCLSQDYKNIELVVVDNHSIDGTKQAARKYTSRVFTQGPERSAQKNFGARVARGTYLLFLDADARLTEGVLSQCVDITHRQEAVMVIIPERHLGDGFWARVKALERSFYLGDDGVEAPWFYERSSFLAIGGYDEAMFAGEDWDLFDRAVQKGLTFSRCDGFINHHLGKLTVPGLIRKKYYYGTNIGIFFSRGIRKGVRRNPLVRKSLLRKWPYLLKFPVEYGGIFVLKFLESVGIFAGLLVSSAKKVSEPEASLSKIVVGIFFSRSGTVEDIFGGKVDWLSLLRRASHNRVLYAFARKLLREEHQLTSRQRADLEKVVAVGEEKLESFRRTIRFLNSTLSTADIPFLVVKTFKFLDYVTFDIDVLVPYDQFQAAQNALAKAGCLILPHPRKQGLHQRNCRKDGLLNIDLHRKFFWQGLEHIDLDFVWAAPERRVVNGIECLCPALGVDFLLHNKQLVYERYYITLLDFLAIKYAYEQRDLDLSAIERQVIKYGWKSSYQTLLGHLNRIHTAFFGAELFEKVPSEGRGPVALPYVYPYREVWTQLKEISRFHRKVPLFDLAYYHWAWGRYYLSGGRHLPYYQHWFDFDLLKND